MIKYAVKCAEGHRFEVWFRSAEDCAHQLAAGLVACPSCGASAREKALMAPRLSRQGAPDEHRNDADAADAAAPSEPPAAAPEPQAAAGRASPTAAMTRAAQTRHLVESRLRALRAHVEATADYVGVGFADEARRIHEGDADARAIYGEATADEVEALRDDGVPCAPIPWIDRRDD